MGLTRKLLSASTLGAVDYRSDKERIARKTAKGARAAKEQNRLLAEQNRILAAGQNPPAARTARSVADEIVKLKALLDDGTLTPEEFAAEKARLLAGG